MASEAFSIGTVVTWRSQAQGSATTKVGTIIEVVPPDTRPATEGRPGLKGCGFGRNHISYVVEVATGKQKQGKRHYWPVVSALKLASQPENPAAVNPFAGGHTFESFKVDRGE